MSQVHCVDRLGNGSNDVGVFVASFDSALNAKPVPLDLVLGDVLPPLGEFDAEPLTRGTRCRLRPRSAVDSAMFHQPARRLTVVMRDEVTILDRHVDAFENRMLAPKHDLSDVETLGKLCEQIRKVTHLGIIVAASIRLNPLRRFTQAFMHVSRTAVARRSPGSLNPVLRLLRGR